MRTAAETLRRLRRERGVTLDELSRRTGVAKATLSRYENGHQTPSADTFFALGQGLAVEFVPQDSVPGAARKSRELDLVCDAALHLPKRDRGPLLFPSGVWKKALA